MTFSQGKGFVIREQMETHMIVQNDITGMTRYEARHRMTLHRRPPLPVLSEDYRKNQLPFLKDPRHPQGEPLRDPRL